MRPNGDAKGRKERGKIITKDTEKVTQEHRPSASSQGKQERFCHDEWIFALVCLMIVALGGCSKNAIHDPSSVRFLIEASPTNLDPRYGTDGVSQRIDRLIFNGLVKRDLQMNLQGDLAEKWENPDPLTYVFHLRPGIKFHDSRPLTSRDVKTTIEYMMDSANKSPKRGAFTMIDSIETPNATTVIFHLKEPYASFLWNLEKSAVGIAPANAGSDFGQHPIGTGPFRFVGQKQEEEVVLERNDDYFAVAAREGTDHTEVAEVRALNSQRSGDSSTNLIRKVMFRIVPDAIVRALELRKGSADVEMSSLSPDMVAVLAKRADLKVTEMPGTNFAYLGVNLEDPILMKKEVRQALAYATDRESLVKYLLHGEARLASGILPPNHWAYEGDVKKYGYDPGEAERLLDAAGYPRGTNGMRIHLTLKVTTQEQARLLGAALQDQWKKAGVDLEVRPLETATFFADLTKGNFQLSYSIWIGANNDPDVFDLVFSSKRTPPNGSNRGHYRNARVDELIATIRAETNKEKRKEYCSEVQKIVAEDSPYVSLWYTDVVSVHQPEIDVQLTPTGDYDFLAR
ncbi:MAG TPA: ABC transporter substrate-binding protein [Candidatus Acidoferrum sp.]|jgi:peptide/nickel transport system substrate-binding protein